MDSTELIKGFGEKLGIEFNPDADGAIAFEVDGMSVAVNPLAQLDSIALTGDLGEPPPEQLENLYKAMLQAQYLFQDTFGATISLNPESNHFMLCKAMSCKVLDVDSFFAEVENFVNTLETWSKLVENYRGAVIAKGATDATEEAPAIAPGLGTNGFMAV